MRAGNRSLNGHLATGPATDPYTSDVAEGLADMLLYLVPTALPKSKEYDFNPAPANFGRFGAARTAHAELAVCFGGRRHLPATGYEPPAADGSRFTPSRVHCSPPRQASPNPPTHLHALRSTRKWKPLSQFLRKNLHRLVVEEGLKAISLVFSMV